MHNCPVKIVHSPTCSLVLILPRWDVIRMQPHHMVALILRSLVVMQMWILKRWLVLFWYLSLSLCWVVSRLKICGDKTSGAYFGGTRIECILFTQSPLCWPKTMARFPPSSFSSELHDAQIQGCILLGQSNFFLSPGSPWQKLLCNPEH